MDPAEPVVTFDPSAKRFEARVEGSDAVAHLDVLPSATIWTLTHTEVPPSLEGQGVGSALVRAALAHVRAEGTTVMPLCPFVVAYVRRHPHEADVVHERFRYMLGQPQGAR
jgi:uncharacterized protein